jgi:hypothetical protein
MSAAAKTKTVNLVGGPRDGTTTELPSELDTIGRVIGIPFTTGTQAVEGLPELEEDPFTGGLRPKGPTYELLRYVRQPDGRLHYVPAQSL